MSGQALLEPATGGGLEAANDYIAAFAETILSTPAAFDTKHLKVGVDLGTANICFAVLDGQNNPIAGEIYPASVVKDGLVLDYFGAVQIVRRLKDKIERRIGARIEAAATAVPPGTFGKNAKAVSYVLESADISVVNVVDEPTAAAQVLNLRHGNVAVVDVGGGTTGISVLRNGEVIAAYDEPTGGTHMSLVLAGNYRISFEDAERLKLDTKNHKEIFHIIKPVIEKMAGIVARFLRGYPVDKIYVVGGASCFDGFEDVFTSECGVVTYKPAHALLVTPLGIALSHSL